MTESVSPKTDAEHKEDAARRAVAERKRRQRARDRAVAEIECVREEWALFLNPARLPQKAGCPADRLRAVIVKELADNALDADDAKATASLAQGLDGQGRADRDTWIVSDTGPGLDRARMLRLFAVKRPLVSTKLFRRPTRGAIGNGLRVVLGGAIASRGRLVVETRGRRHVLDVDRATGETVVAEEGPSEVATGTRVTVTFGPALPRRDDDGELAVRALCCAGPAAEPMLTHPDWYDDDGFAELVDAVPAGTTLADLAAQFGLDVDADRPVTATDLALLRASAPRPPRLLPLGKDHFPGHYARELVAEGVPVLVEAWAEAVRCAPSHARGTVTLLVNRSPVVAPVSVQPDRDGKMCAWGCNLAHVIDRVSPKACYGVVLAVTTPVVALTTEGKEPNLEPLWPAIEPALATAMRKAYRAVTASAASSGDIKDAAYEVMAEAYDGARGSRRRAEARQVMYVGRRLMLERLPAGTHVSDTYFLRLLPRYIAEHPLITADWQVDYDDRGHLWEPHTGHAVPLGTASMEEYLTDRKRRRGQPDLVAVDDALYPTLGPENRYRTLLCIEKEGFFGLIQEARIMERFDCGLISSKGVWGTAARWGIENLALDGVRILVLHDFDRSGACIAHTINHNTQRYQFKNPPEVIDLGLSLADAKEMGLQDEAAEDEGPGEDRLREYGRSEDEISCLMQGRRVELNAMNADQFIGYVEEALTEHGAGKVVPRDGVLERHARRLLARRVVRDELPPLIAAAEARVATVALSADLRERVHDRQEEEPELPWEDALEAELEDVTPDEGWSAC